MTQTERRLWLIKYLLGERPEYSDIAVPTDSKEQFKLYRSLVNVRMPREVSDEYIKIEDEFLRNEAERKGVVSLEDLAPVADGIYLYQGDITTLECDAIVNAANSKMLGCFYPCHSCIDNCIHTFSGIRLRQECYSLMEKQKDDEPTGSAKLTKAYNLPCKYVIHTVGPIVFGELTDENRKMLASCYRECLKLARENNLKSIAFCCISTGEFRFPNKEAAEIAVDTVRSFKAESACNIDVIFNVFKDIDREIYERLLKN